MEIASDICGITRYQYYYKHKSGRKGRPVSSTTKLYKENTIVEVNNEAVIDWIKAHLKNPLNTEGYHRMTGTLQLAGFYINHKKVYRLMKESHLLRPKKRRGKKTYVKYRKLCPEGPLRLLEIDIKHVWVAGLQRQSYVLTIIDVFTRVVLYWDVALHMRKADIERAWAYVIENHLEKHQMYGWQIDIEVRSDNGSQFVAKTVQQYLIRNHLKQTFTHPYTPQENGHIESFHAILAGYLQGKTFADLITLRTNLDCFYDHYNNHRVHGSTVNIPPNIFWWQWQKGNIERQILDLKQRRVRFKLKVPRQEISPNGQRSQRERSRMLA